MAGSKSFRPFLNSDRGLFGPGYVRIFVGFALDTQSFWLDMIYKWCLISCVLFFEMEFVPIQSSYLRFRQFKLLKGHLVTNWVIICFSVFNLQCEIHTSQFFVMKTKLRSCFLNILNFQVQTENECDREMLGTVYSC